MRRTLSYCLILTLALGMNTYASDEIEFETDPIVTVDLEKETNSSSSVFPSFLLVGTSITIVAIVTTWMCLRKG